MISYISNNSIYHNLFVYTQFKCQTVLFNSQIRPDQVLPHRVRVELGVMAIKGYSTLPQSSSITAASLSDCLMSYLEHWLAGGGSYPAAGMQSAYSTAPVE